VVSASLRSSSKDFGSLTERTTEAKALSLDPAFEVGCVRYVESFEQRTLVPTDRPLQIVGLDRLPEVRDIGLEYTVSKTQVVPDGKHRLRAQDLPDRVKGDRELSPGSGRALMGPEQFRGSVPADRAAFGKGQEGEKGKRTTLHHATTDRPIRTIEGDSTEESELKHLHQSMPRPRAPYARAI